MNYDDYKSAVETLNLWAKAYYRDDSPLATDEEYDELYHKVLEFENKNPNLALPNSPTNRVGYEISEGFSKRAHLAKMWSMEDIFDEGEFKAWLKRGEKETFELFCEPKFDGASLNLFYENGALQCAITRGDGSVGEDVTGNARVIESIPARIPYDGKIEIRGEIVIAKEDFNRLNEIRAQNGESLLANPRNAAAGSLRQLDSKITASRKLRFMPWGVGFHELNFTKHSEIMDFVRNLGFLKDDFCRVVKPNEVQNAYLALLSQRENKEIMMDGMVIRINELSKCDDLGFTVKFPRFMVAYKFPAIEKSTKLLDIALQVGRTGVVTPVAVVESVNIDGANVQNATLHNFDEIARLGLMKGDFVSIIRSGDVIPKITKVFAKRRDGAQTPILRPQFCPVCGEKLHDEGIFIKCQNLGCKARMINSLIYFASKKCMNIDGLGIALIELLYNSGKISTLIDIYRLKFDDFAGLEGFKEKKINNILNAIEASKNAPLERFITALGIEHIGEVAARKIALEFGENWLNASAENLLKIDGFGEAMVESFVEFIQINRAKIEELLSVINPIATQKPKTSAKFDGKTIVITGTLDKSRDEYKEIFLNLGAKVANSVSKKTDFLIAGESAGSKLEKALELGIKVISQAELKDFIES